MPRAIWKGAISFGLVHVPVSLYPASSSSGIDFDWLDARSMDPVGYKRINKRTGKEITKENIVRGVKHAGGDYVVLSDDEIRAAYPRTTQTIVLESFADPRQIPFVFLNHPYYLEPHSRGDRVYALLRDALAASGKVGVGRVVIQTREHLAALIPDGPLLMLDTLRWGGEIRPADELNVPPVGGDVKAAEMKMARALIDEMTAPWDASQHTDRFRDAVMALVEKKAAAGETAHVEPLEEGVPASGSSNVVDLTELLKRSLGGGGKAAKPGRAASDVADGSAAPEDAAGKAEPTRRRRGAAGARRRA